MTSLGHNELNYWICPYVQCKQQSAASAKTNLYPLPVVLLTSSVREPSFWLYVMVGIISWKTVSSELMLTHWGRVTHICVCNLIIIGSYNGLSPSRRQAIIWTNAGILLIGPSGTNFSEILIEILTFSFRKIRSKVSSAKWRPFCVGLNVLMDQWYIYFVYALLIYLKPHAISHVPSSNF